MVIVGSSVAGSLHHVMGVGSGVFGRSFHSTHGSKYTIQAGLMKFSASCCKLIPVYKSRSFCRVIPFSTSLPNTAYFGVKSPVPRAQSNDHIPISLTAVTPYGSGVGIHRNPTNNTHGHTRLEKTKTIKRSKLKQKACLVPRDIANTGTMIEELETFLDKNSKREVIREPHMFCPNLEKHFETEEEQQARKRSVVITNETQKMEGPSIKQSLSCSSQFDHRRNAVIKLVKDGGKVPLDNNTLKKNPSSRVMFVADTLSVAKCHERSIKLTVDRGTSASFRLQVPTVFSNVGNHCSPVLEPQYENFTNENCNVPSDLVNDASVDRVVKLSTVDNTVEAPLRNENPREEGGNYISDDRVGLSRLYDAVLVVDNVAVAKSVVKKLTEEYGSLVHACDTEVAEIDAKQETPVANGKLICFSIYSGQGADFGSGKTAIWVDILDGGKDVLMAFAPFFEDASIKKVWHNYSFDHHVLENHGIKPSGFHADTMHLARLWDSSRRTKGGYSLEALTGDPRVMSRSDSPGNGFVSSKISMKTIFGRRKLKKNGSEGKIVFVPSVEELQKKERIPWICYSVRDSISTLQLFVSLKKKLMDMYWVVDGVIMGTMYDFYVEYWCYFGEVLVKMESEGMLVDRKYLSEMEKIANKEQKIAAARFRKWASMYCRDALYMNVGSDVQLRQLFFGGTVNSKDSNESVPHTRTFKVPNVDYVDGENYKSVQKYRNIKLHLLKGAIPTEVYTPSGWPSISNDVLKTFSGKISANAYDTVADDFELNMGEADNVEQGVKSIDKVTGNESEYGTAYDAFGGGEEGKEACVAIASLCEMNSIHSLLSSFILPLQGKEIMGRKGRIHCSLNINTETGRLSSRRPNLQNQPALEKDRYRIRQAFIAEPGKSLIVADYGQLELRILAHLANCKSMIDAFKAGGDFHSRTAMNMYPYIREAVEDEKVLLEWTPKPDEDKPPVPLLKDIFASQRRKAKMLNFSIAYGKTPQGLARDWKVSLKEARDTVNLWYNERREVLQWQEERKIEAHRFCCVHTLLGRARRFPSLANASSALRSHIERAAINSPVQGSAADVAMCAMLEISNNSILKELGWKLIMQVHDEVILEGPTESEELAKRIVVECMSKPFRGTNFLRVDLSVDAECAPNWYAAK